MAQQDFISLFDAHFRHGAELFIEAQDIGADTKFPLEICTASFEVFHAAMEARALARIAVVITDKKSRDAALPIMAERIQGLRGRIMSTLAEKGYDTIRYSEETEGLRNDIVRFVSAMDKAGELAASGKLPASGEPTGLFDDLPEGEGPFDADAYLSEGEQ